MVIFFFRVTKLLRHLRIDPFSGTKYSTDGILGGQNVDFFNFF